MPLKLPSFKKKILSIDFGGKQVKIIEGQASKNMINIKKGFTIDLPDEVYRDGEILEEDLLSNLIKESLKENKIRTEQAYGIINSSHIITRSFSLPKVPEKDIPSIIEYQLDELFPVDPEGYIINPLIIGNRMEDEMEKTDILLVGTPRKIVLDHLDLMKSIGLKPLVLDFQGNAMAKLLNFNSSINDFYNTRDMVIASIDMGHINSKLSIIKNGKILVTRVLDIGTMNVLDSIDAIFDYTLENSEEKLFQIEDINHNTEEYTDYSRLVNITRTVIDNLLENIEMVFRFYTTREMVNMINFIVLQGSLSNINGIENLFSNYFNIPSIKLTNLNKVKINQDISKFSNAVGGLIRIAEVQR
mgnify:CR=1 FL=1